MRRKIAGLILVVLALVVLIARGIYEYGFEHARNEYFALAPMVLLLVGVALSYGRTGRS
ncbi:hypothetical protein [Mycobacteroides abscessus]|uniref:hypothetical protein n=1 Tax=Mycobacteroides abscessus TaxID=36809 RepID=UPI0016011CC6|nr:hypothetical protein [Mycobacteroides abscessus]